MLPYDVTRWSIFSLFPREKMSEVIHKNVGTTPICWIRWTFPINFGSTSTLGLVTKFIELLLKIKRALPKFIENVQVETPFSVESIFLYFLRIIKKYCEFRPSSTCIAIHFFLNYYFLRNVRRAL